MLTIADAKRGDIGNTASRYARAFFDMYGFDAITLSPYMGKDSVDQKGRFVGLDKGPKSRSDVLHLYNFKNIRNNAEIAFLVQAVLNRAEQAGYTDGIRSINYK